MQCSIGSTALVVALGMGLAASPNATAQEATGEASTAQSWGLTGEQPARLTGTVVDLLCELGGDCAEACGRGDRQLGIRTEAGRLVIVAKNGQPLFNGAVFDLAPYCGQKVEVDGLFAGHSGTTIYQVQQIRPAGAADFEPANRWSEVWAERNADLEASEAPWYRRDPRVLERIEKDGYLGLGDAADRAFIEEWF